MVRELLSSQGFPAYDFLVVAATGTNKAVCSFNADRESNGFPRRKRTSSAGQANNSMNVGVIGSALMYNFGFVVRADSLF